MDDVMWMMVGRRLKDLDPGVLFEMYVRLLEVADALEKHDLVTRTLEEAAETLRKIRGVS